MANNESMDTMRAELQRLIGALKLCAQEEASALDFSSEQPQLQILADVINDYLLLHAQTDAVQTGVIKAIADIQEQYINGVALKDVFQSALTHILSISQSEFGFIGAIVKEDDNAPYLRTYAVSNIAWDEASRQMYESAKDKGIEFHNLDTLFGYTIKTGEVVISNDPAHDPRAGGLPSGHPSLNAYLGLPIYSSSGMVAIAGVANREGGYTTAQARLVKPLINTIAAILESAQHQDTIRHLATFDQLTQIHNRAYFDREIKQIITQHKREGKVFALLLIDLNGFKNINDKMGHYIGDLVLEAFANRLRKNTKSSDMIARLGGDEFVVVVQNIGTSVNAGVAAKRIHEAAAVPYKIDNYELNCGVSIGIAPYPRAGQNGQDLLKRADLALYKAKKDRSYHFFEETLEVEFAERVLLEDSFIHALENNNLSILYQPQICLTTNKIIGIEALMRWKISTGKFMPPSSFVPIAEELGMADKLNMYVITHSLDDIASKLIPMPDNFKLAINLSPHVANLDQHITDIVKQLSMTDADALKYVLEFELTESDFMSSRGFTEADITNISETLHDHGISLAIDDFGVKYSSINRLLNYQFDVIKVDMEFVQSLVADEDNTARAIIETILFLAKKLGITVVAEGVETAEQAGILREIGCEYAQGYHFYTPMEIDEVIDLIKQQEAD